MYDTVLPMGIHTGQNYMAKSLLTSQMPETNRQHAHTHPRIQRCNCIDLWKWRGKKTEFYLPKRRLSKEGDTRAEF